MELENTNIQIQNQTLTVPLEVTGTPYSILYHSDRVEGRNSATQLDIPLLEDEVPDELKRVDLEILVAGQKHAYSLAPEPNQSYSFNWDRRDAYGNPAQGRRDALIRIGYVYQGEYNEPAGVQRSFAQFTEIADRTGLTTSGDRDQNEITVWKEVRRPLGGWDSRGVGLGGWNLDVHHTYDLTDKTLYFGDGRSKRSEDVSKILTTVAGGGTDSPTVAGTNATEIALDKITAIEVDQRGGVYIADSINRRVYYLSTDGIITVVAGNGQEGTEGDGGPAIEAQLTPTDIALDSEENLYIADMLSNRIRLVEDGIISTIAGGGTEWFWTDGAHATDIRLSHEIEVGIGENDEVYVCTGTEIHKIDVDNRIRKIGGGGLNFPSTNPHISEALLLASSLSISTDGSIYFVNYDWQRNYENVVCRIEPDGRVTHITGGGTQEVSNGMLATNARLLAIQGVTTTEGGDIYISDIYEGILRVSQEGLLFYEGGETRNGYWYGSSEDGTPLSQSNFMNMDVKIPPEGDMYIVDGFHRTLRKVVFSLGSKDLSAIPSEEGDQLYIFSEDGRHLKTVDTLSGTSIYEFTYSEEGYLETIEESVEENERNVTVIEREGGALSGILAPYGQRTALTEDQNGYLQKITNPAGEEFQFGYLSGGLLNRMQDPRGNEATFDYDTSGRLTLQKEPDGGEYIIKKSDRTNGYQVTLDTAEFRHSSFLVEQPPSGEERQVNSCCGRSTVFSRSSDGTTQDVKYPNGSSSHIEQTTAPQLGMQTPLTKRMEYVTPAGINRTTSSERTVELADEDDPLSLQTVTNKTRINNRIYTATYDADSRTSAFKTPWERTQERVLDDRGRLSSSRTVGLTPTQITYDRGRIAEISQDRSEDGSDGTMRTRFNYYGEDSPSNSYLRDLIDSEGRETRFRYDDAGRVEELVLPGNREVKYDHDANGNVTSITPPGRPAHRFEYTSGNQVEKYQPPAPTEGEDSAPTLYRYNRDGQLRRVDQPTGEVIILDYHDTGDIKLIKVPGREIRYDYDLPTGNLTTITSSDGASDAEELSFGYDGDLVKSTTWSGTVNGTLERTYNNDLQVESQQINGENEIIYRYDGDGKMERAGGLEFVHNSNNGLLRGTVLQGVTDEIEYYDSGEIKSYTAAYQGSTQYSVQYEYDDIGRISKKTKTVDDQTDTYEYGYDQAGRLHAVEKNGTEVGRYEYDANGNRKRHVTPEGTIQGTYDRQDRLQKYGDTTYEYAPTGELRSKTIDGETTTYEYDVLGNLTEVVLPDGTEIEYIIDGQNRRIGKKVNGTFERRFLYKDGLNPIAELDGDGDVLSQFVYGERGNVPSDIIRNNTSYRIIADHLGSPRLVINVLNGEIIQRMDYDEYGNVITDSNPGFQPFGFSGGIYDPYTILTRFGVRDYDPRIGRWTTKDPILFESRETNMYEYAVNNPVNNDDFTGFLTRSKAKEYGAVLLGFGLVTSFLIAHKVIKVHPYIRSASLIVGGGLWLLGEFGPQSLFKEEEAPSWFIPHPIPRPCEPVIPQEQPKQEGGGGGGGIWDPIVG